MGWEDRAASSMRRRCGSMWSPICSDPVWEASHGGLQRVGAGWVSEMAQLWFQRTRRGCVRGSEFEKVKLCFHPLPRIIMSPI
eukprot:2685454-Pyramimonas_sp.AAC.1